MSPLPITVTLSIGAMAAGLPLSCREPLTVLAAVRARERLESNQREHLVSGQNIFTIMAMWIKLGVDFLS